MSAATNAVNICNLALDYVEAAPISSIEAPVTDTETLCARWYDNTRRELLRKYIWNFAKTRKNLSLNATSPIFGYADAYNLPNNFIRLLSIGDDSLYDYRKEYEIENGQIILDNNGATTLKIIYIFDQVSVNKFDSLFVKLLALELASNIAYQITGKNTVVKRVETLLQKAREVAAGVDGQERPPKRIQRSNFTNSRRNMQAGVASPYTTFDR